MNFHTTIVLLILLITVGAWFVLSGELDREATYEVERRERKEEKATGKRLFDSGDRFEENVRRFTIETDEGTATFAKEGDDWWQTEPVRFRLTSWNVGNVPTDLGGLRSVRRFTPGVDGSPSMEKIQLAPKPLAMITLTAERDGAESRHTVKLGRKSIGGVAYAMAGDTGDVHVVNDDLHDRILDKAFSSWRDKSIKSPKEGQVDQVVIERGDGTITLAKADGNWIFQSPHAGRADRSAVETLLNDIGGFYIKDFVIDRPDDPSLYGLATPTHAIRIRRPAPPAADEVALDNDDASGETSSPTDAEPTLSTLRIGGPQDMEHEAFYATWAEGAEGGDVVFTLGKSSVENLDKTVDDFRDARVTPIEASEVRQIRLERTGAGAVHFLQTDGSWAFDASIDPGFPADHDAVQDLADNIAAAKADAYRIDAVPEGDPLATVTLGALARSEPDLIRIHDAGEGTQYLVLRNNEATGYLVANDALDTLFQPMRTWRDRRILELDADQISQVTVEHGDGSRFTFEREVAARDQPAPEAASPGDTATSQSVPQPGTTPAEPPHGPWHMAGNAAFETASVNALVDVVANLRAETWRADNAGPGDGTLRVQVHSAGHDPVVITLDPTSRVATLEGLDMPFEVSESAAEKLAAELRDRTVLPITTVGVNAVVVSHSDSLLTLSRNADDDYVDAGGATIDQSAAGGLFDTIAGLRVERYVTAAPPDAPAITIDIQLADKTHTILIADSENHERPIHVDDRACLVNESTFEKLVAGLIGNTSGE